MRIMVLPITGRAGARSTTAVKAPYAFQRGEPS